MATLEKLIKAFEILKVQPSSISEDGQASNKKKELPLTKKDKITQCTMIADAICSQNMRSVADFPKYLGTAMETFLMFYDDDDSDIRMIADECLNKTIKTLLDSHLTRLHVELYKEIKKETSVRRLRAVLSRFAELAHLIRAQKCRAYTVNILPCLDKVCRYTEESVQETLGTAMVKIMPVLGKFTNDTEIRLLLQAFLSNLALNSAVARRTAAMSLVAICQHSRKPMVSFVWLVSFLLDQVIPVQKDPSVSVVLGTLLCLRHLIPHLNETPKHVVVKGSIGVRQKEEETHVQKDQLIQIYEVILHYCTSSDHNITTAALEALHQLLRTPPKVLLEVLLSEEGIQQSYIYTEDGNLASRFKSSSQSLAPPSPDEDATLDDEPLSVQTEQSLDDAMFNSFSMPSDDAQPSEDSGILDEKPDANNYVSIDTESDDKSGYSSVQVSQVVDGRWSPFTSPGVHTGPTNKKRPPALRPAVSDDRLLESADAEGASIASSPGLGSDFKVGNIGSFKDEDVPLLYCTRLLCSHYLLTGTPGSLMQERNVRISVKSLALSSLGSLFCLYPKAFFLDVHKPENSVQDSEQKVWDVLLYDRHHDPHLRGHTAVLLGNLLRHGLRESCGHWNKWAKSCTSASDYPTLESLLLRLLTITQDESSVATRLGLTALKQCLQPVLGCITGQMGLKILDILLSLKDNPYWLVKVELMEVICEVPFRVLHHLETLERENSAPHNQPRTLTYQERILQSVLLYLLGDEDHRVRSTAAKVFVRVVGSLFFEMDHPYHDPVIAQARAESNLLLDPTLHDLVQDDHLLIHGLVKPFCKRTLLVYSFSVDMALSRIVSMLVKQFLSSTSKYLAHGCCHALCLLSSEYLVTVYVHAWTAIHSDSLPPRPSVPILRRHSSTTLNASTEVPPPSTATQEADLVLHLLALITSTPVALDLWSHQHVLQLLGNLMAGSCYHRLNQTTVPNNGTDGSPDQEISGSLGDTQLVKKMELLYTHLFRLLNIFSLVAEEQVPVQSKPVLPSLPNAPTLSPIKRKVKPKEEILAQLPAPGSKNSPSKPTQEKAETEKEKVPNKGGGLGQFINQPIYIKLFEMLRAAHTSYKISLDIQNSEKFTGLLRICLEVLSVMLEVTSLQEMGKYAEELLNYLKTVMALEPCSSIQVVRQLLKCLFGTNLLNMWEYTHNNPAGSSGRKPGRATRLTASVAPGLYHSCFTAPYTHFTQTLASSSLKPNALAADTEELGSWLSWMRKRSEKKIKMGNKSEMSSLAAHIRLFEPVVIKALKLYTVASNIQLQCEVLNLLSQLVQLRVNYCLLDSDQIFINFVLKQFEHIEEGQIPHSEILIPHIFYFLVLLSYERYHSKPIIGVPKIIQLCDGLMASGQPADKCGIPALQPVVEDLFLLRGTNKLDMGKELDAQREVIVSVLLRLVHYPGVIELFLLILHQSYKDGEDRWKKLSRQVVDTLLPLLARQQIQLDNQQSLNSLHRLFEAVAPSVFRPVDILLKFLFVVPLDLRTSAYLQRWMCLVLSVMRVLIVQGKEEVVLSRLGDLALVVAIPKYCVHLKCPVLPLPIPIFTDQQQENPHPEITFARFLLQVVGVAVEAVHTNAFCPSQWQNDHFFTCQQLSHLLLYLMHMFQSGLFRRVTSSAMSLLRIQCPDVLEADKYYTVEEINGLFLELALLHPTLLLQWCNLLILLNYDNQGYWERIFRSAHRRNLSGASPKCGDRQNLIISSNCNMEIVRRGGLILMCDYVCENLSDAERMTWLIVNHVHDLVLLSHEPPAQDFISAIHRNSAASGLFVQAIHARCDNISKRSFLQKTLHCLEAIHPSQSGALLALIIDKYLVGHYLSICHRYQQLAVRRLEMLLGEPTDLASAQLPLEDIDKLLEIIQTRGLENRYAELVSLLHQLRLAITGVNMNSIANAVVSSSMPNVDQDWFMTQVENLCTKGHSTPQEAALLLSKLNYKEILTIMNNKDFQLLILEQCLILGTKQMLANDTVASPIAEEPFDGDVPLYRVSRHVLLQQVSHLTGLLPRPHQVLTPCLETASPRETKYYDRLSELFSDTAYWVTLFQVIPSVTCYLRRLDRLPTAHHQVPVNSLEDFARFGILCAETIQWILISKQQVSCEVLHFALSTLDATLKNSSLSAAIGLPENVAWVCSAVSAIHSLVIHYRQELTDMPFPSSKHSPEDMRAQQACAQVGQLILWMEDKNESTATIPSFIMTQLSSVIRGLARLPLVNSFARTPPVLWQLGWTPEVSGEFRTSVPPPPGEFLQEREVLLQYIYRVNVLGWTSRQQFEETWMALLGVLSATPLIDSEGEEQEELERVLASCMAVKSITALLLHTLLLPQPGNPHSSFYLRQSRDKPLSFLHTRCGKKLQTVRVPIHRMVERLMGLRNHMHLLSTNTEKVANHVDYSMGQVSLEYLCIAAGLMDDVEDFSSSTDSSPDATVSVSGAVCFHQREQALAASGLDIHSCLHFLLDLYSQWLSPQSCTKTPLVLLTEITRSVVMLSDIFMERSQYEWMLDTLLELHRSHPAEDEIIAQYLIYGICKATAVLNMDQEMLEKLKKLVDISLKSSYLPTRISTLYSLLYLLEQGGGDETNPLLATALDYLAQHIDSNNMPNNQNEEHQLILWSLAFYIIENYRESISDDFGQKVFQLSLNVCSDDNTSPTLYLAILHGLERLLVGEIYSSKEIEMVVKLTIDRLRLGNPTRALAALGVLFSCMYIGTYERTTERQTGSLKIETTGKDTEVWKSGLSQSDTINSNTNDTAVATDSEHLIAAMERVTVVFERIRRGLPFEAELVSQVIPVFLMEFFPPQDVLNKVIGEFVSSQQPYPKFLSTVLFQVFEHLHQQSQDPIICDWVMLSLSNFTQRSPVSMAIWCLSCCFVSASTNQWLRALFPHVQNRMGKMEEHERQLFCIAALDFHSQLQNDDQRHTFRTTIQSVAVPGTPYAELLLHL